MLHRVREACGAGNFKLNEVEIDETYIGGKRSSMSNSKRKELFGTGRGTVGKTPVFGMHGRDGQLEAFAFPADTRMDKALLTELGNFQSALLGSITAVLTMADSPARN